MVIYIENIMNIKEIQRITDKEYDSNLTDYQNKVKLYE